MSPSEHLLEQASLAIFKKATQGVAAKIGDLNHPRQLTVNEQGSLNDVADLRPERTVLTEALHHQRVFSCHGLVVVMNEQSVLASGWI